MKKLNILISDTESLIIFGLIVVATIIFASIMNRYFNKILNVKNKELNIDITKFKFLKHLIVLTIYLVGIGWALLVLPLTKSFAHSILVGAGATTLILGLALQQILSS